MAARESAGEVRLAGCWGHKFIDAEKNDPTRADEALDMIGELYEVEARARAPYEGWELLKWRQKLREVAAMLYTICETAKACGVNPRDYLRRVVMNDIKSPHTVTLPWPIEEMMAGV